eukprot:CAMPEP_0195070022 /NCGR_PEP_ID=MMETSP0448-20130528/14186_1 /TAXON_ID=66468 /ORGANISM="Heterocapsa triquestra, Strain CCMP 448" /LENGTH=35 /DNA_ID= /DNA_START= /DNA_END= /DNA_ORIENTATION=
MGTTCREGLGLTNVAPPTRPIRPSAEAETVLDEGN